ncbi:hypothetical protein NLG97_g5421 [Lecanicillium saksenae]|uniref:Uncharacterized protein n=1 Tax=Lecanicillium saksenae TaxID=468837 RepID=A0ACC1QU68_9HYPO|nr:hypothetical protein NLG97_g5421 [Lecanicillium saksenae]
MTTSFVITMLIKRTKPLKAASSIADEQINFSDASQIVFFVLFSMGYPETFYGFCVGGPKSWNKFQKCEIKPKPFGDHDVDVQIDACGICSSGLHVTGGWGEYKGPLCLGHEVVCKAVGVGKHVKNTKVGDRVGVGAQVWSCLECDNCKDNNQNDYTRMVDTYNALNEVSSWTHGGSRHISAHDYFIFKIPEKLEANAVAPLLCAGITTYSLLVRAGWAVALGAKAIVIAHSPGKVEYCKKLGTNDVIITEKEGSNKPWRAKFDFVLNRADVTDKFDMVNYLSIINLTGDFHMVGISDKPFPHISAGLFASGVPKLTGSHLGNHQEMDALQRLLRRRV